MSSASKLLLIRLIRKPWPKLLWWNQSLQGRVLVDSNYFSLSWRMRVWNIWFEKCVLKSIFSQMLQSGNILPRNLFTGIPQLRRKLPFKRSRIDTLHSKSTGWRGTSWFASSGRQKPFLPQAFRQRRKKLIPTVSPWEKLPWIFSTGQDIRALPLLLLLVFIKRESPSNSYCFIYVLEMRIAKEK